MTTDLRTRILEICAMYERDMNQDITLSRYVGPGLLTDVRAACAVPDDAPKVTAGAVSCDPECVLVPHHAGKCWCGSPLGRP